MIVSVSRCLYHHSSGYFLRRSEAVIPMYFSGEMFLLIHEDLYEEMRIEIVG